MSAAAWQHSIPLATLKGLARVFKEQHKPHCYGAFALAKERDVAEAMARGQCMWLPAALPSSWGHEPAACLLYKVLQQPSVQHDWRGVPVNLPAGSVVVQHFAATTVGAGSTLLARLRANMPPPADGGLFRAERAPLWVEVYEEDEVARAVVGEHGLQWAASKVLAGSEVKGLYTDAALPLTTPSGAELATLCPLYPAGLLPASTVAAYVAEAMPAKEHAAQHYSSYNKRKSWTAVSLRGYGPTAHIEKPSEMSRAWKVAHAGELLLKADWTAMAMRCTESAEYAVGLGFELDRVRYMYLAPGGELSRHADITDREAGVAPGKVARLHLPLVTNQGVTFHAWDARGRHLTHVPQVGQLFYLDQRKPHRVTNEGNTARVHMVIDVYSDSRLREALGRAWAVERVPPVRFE